MLRNTLELIIFTAIYVGILYAMKTYFGYSGFSRDNIGGTIIHIGAFILYIIATAPCITYISKGE